MVGQDAALVDSSQHLTLGILGWWCLQWGIIDDNADNWCQCHGEKKNKVLAKECLLHCRCFQLEFHEFIQFLVILNFNHID